MLGIPPATLRTWEERYGLLVPERSPGGHRVYSRDQVEQLRFVKAQLDQGISPADAHRLLAERAAAGSVSFGAREAAGTRLLILLAERDPYAEAGADGFLQKLLDPLQLVSVVKDLLGDSAFLHPSSARPR